MYMNNALKKLFFLVCFSVLFNLVCSAEKSKALLLNCGSENGGKDAEGRVYESDVKYLVGVHPHARAHYQDASILSDVPFMDARIFPSNATYRLPIDPKSRYFLRLYFYPAEYSDLNISSSFFSVLASGVTLLSNFSASITAQALTQAFLIKEFSLAPMDSDTLDLTFVPEDYVNHSFAFVNGIELVAVPRDLFGSGPMVGFLNVNISAENANLETMYRLTVAGQYIPPTKDSGGLGRAWYNDDLYVYSEEIGIRVKANGRVPIKYNGFPGHVAPPDVYSSARIMGENSQANLMFNLTWLFDVDANFTYIVRFHFCDFVLTRPNQMAFNIYINNQTAQADPSPADIIAWTGRPGQPIYKDYMITIDGSKSNANIQVDVHPSTRTNPQYYDAQVNGIEIFKINDKSNNLAGLNPEPSVIDVQDIAGHITFEAAGRQAMLGAAGFFLVATLCIVVSKKKGVVSGSDSHSRAQLPTYGGSHSSNSSSANSGKFSILAQGLCRHFSLGEIKHATKNFGEKNVIGVGGFGKVYKGVIDQNVNVAIKRSNPQSEQGIQEFETEIEMLSKLRHKHLVSLIGFCEEDHEMCLVYDYMANGTLSDHLQESKKSKLLWKQRLEICIGAARGLHYLHTGATNAIIHRDVKTTNILLDEQFVAKVSDFGLSKTGTAMENGHVSTVVRGSFGYLDPEYYRRRRLTEKSDVYSFGVVLFELLCGRPALIPSLPRQEVSLAEWAIHCKRNGTLENIIDPEVKEQIDPECLKKFSETAEKCLADEGIKRPSMGDVLWNLELALKMQQNPDASKP